MSRELIIRPEAEAYALQVFRWYNEQLPGLGQEFLAEVESAIEANRAHPEASRKVYREYRRALTRRFPYAVFYALHADRIVVFAILHAARDPRLWRQRAKNAR